jgi:hypothetical protein
VLLLLYQNTHLFPCIYTRTAMTKLELRESDVSPCEQCSLGEIARTKMKNENCTSYQLDLSFYDVSSP